jgi:hypothetical protein
MNVVPEPGFSPPVPARALSACTSSSLASILFHVFPECARHGPALTGLGAFPAARE